MTSSSCSAARTALMADAALLQQHASMKDDILQRIRRRCTLVSAGMSVPGAGLLSCLGLPAGTFLKL